MSFRPHPWILRTYLKWRKTPDAWVTFRPWIFHPADVSPLAAVHNWIRVHEETHFDRQKHSYPVLWALKYFFSTNFRYQEEILAMREELKAIPSFNRVPHANWLAVALIVDYGVNKSQEEIMSELLFGLEVA